MLGFLASIVMDLRGMEILPLQLTGIVMLCELDAPGRCAELSRLWAAVEGLRLIMVKMFFAPFGNLYIIKVSFTYEFEYS